MNAFNQQNEDQITRRLKELFINILLHMVTEEAETTTLDFLQPTMVAMKKYTVRKHTLCYTHMT